MQVDVNTEVGVIHDYALLLSMPLTTAPCVYCWLTYFVKRRLT
jgi:hypothetical protein